MKQEKATGVVFGVIAVVVLALAGFGIYAYKHSTVSTDDDSEETRTIPRLGDTGSSTISIVGGTSSSTAYDDDSTGTPKPVATAYKPKANTATAYNARATYVGTAYRNSAFGLTVPGSYQVSPTQNVYAGVPTTASYTFYTNGVYAYTINVFSKEQWNNIRIQETINAKEGTGLDYFGEGRYLGENKTWIYSYVPGSYMPSGVLFY